MSVRQRTSSQEPLTPILPFEVEYIGRWGDSTGQTAADWHIANLTDRAAAGYQGTGDFRQSGNPHPANATTPPANNQTLETSKDVPYRTNLTNTLGASNLGTLPLIPLVDLNGAASGNDFSSTWTNNGPTNIADSINAIASDGDSANLASMTATIVAGVNANNVLSATSFGGIAISYNPANSTLSMTGSSSPANYQAVLRSITYNNTAGGPGVGSVSINVYGYDGLYHSKIAAATVTISPDMAPVVDLNGAGGGNGFASTWTNAGPANITGAASATVTDSDNANLASMTATIVSGSHAGNVLAATAPGGSGITVSYNSVSGVLSMTGTASVANYQSTLRSITYNNTAGGPGTARSPSTSRRTTAWSTAISPRPLSRSAWVRRTRWPTGRFSTTSRRGTGRSGHQLCQRCQRHCSRQDGVHSRWQHGHVRELHQLLRAVSMASSLILPTTVEVPTPTSRPATSCSTSVTTKRPSELGRRLLPRPMCK